jgi:hypothetical protein
VNSRSSFLRGLASLFFINVEEARAATISISITGDGSALKGTVLVSASVSPTKNLKRVEFSVDGVVKLTDTSVPFEFNWDTTAYADGSHVLEAVAYYSQRSSTATLGVNVANSVTPPPPPPPPPTGWPDSFLAGPSGPNNILPASVDGALLGIWYDGSESTAAGKRAGVQKRIADCGRTFDFLGVHGAGPNGGQYGAGSEDFVHGLGSVPVMSYSPGRVTKGTTNLNTMQEINNGLHDATYRDQGSYWKSLGFRIMVRLFWEFNGNWFPWSPTANTKANDGYPNPGCTAAEWKLAFQRVVYLMTGAGGNSFGGIATAGATNVGIGWSPSEGQDRTIRDNCYPGDVYVDWVMPDAYNHVSTGWDTPLHGPGWAEFREMFDYTNMGNAAVSTYSKYGGVKPFVPGESGSKYDKNGTWPGASHVLDQNRKANWYRNIDAVAKENMPNLTGLELFDVYVPAEYNDWMVDSNQTGGTQLPRGSFDAVTYQGFKDFAASARWNAGVAGGAT